MVPHKRLLHTGLQNYDHVDLDSGEVSFAAAFKKKTCVCCSTDLHHFQHDLGIPPSKQGHSRLRWLHLEICPACGWWHYRQEHEILVNERLRVSTRATHWELSHALQTEFELEDSSLPVSSLQQHLFRHWEDRKLISAQQAEDLVASLLQEHHGGTVVRTTANANAADGGIDLYITHDGDGKIKRAVQVKRRITEDTESVKDVRNFVGAMVLAGADRGVFVTTASRFTKVAKGIPEAVRNVKFRLELDLVDGDRLFEMLQTTTHTKPVALPPGVELNQEWRDKNGTAIAALDLFTGDLRDFVGHAA